jgi:COP9 signalosome complex subunit 3
MVEAYKKYVLLALLVHGKVPNLPRYTSSVVQRHHKTAFPQYTEFANAYATHNTDELHKCAETNSEVFQKDHNFGLVKQCIQSLYRRNIQRFTQTYLTFSLQDIATSVNLGSAKDAEKQVIKMIENGDIFATINQKDGMVSFHEDAEQYDTSRMTTAIDQQIQKVIEIGKKVRNTDETIASNPAYIQKTSVHERGRWDLEEAAMFDGAEKM